VLLFAAVAIVVGLVFQYHRYGRTLYAVGGNEEAAWAAGINVDRLMDADRRVPSATSTRNSLFAALLTLSIPLAIALVTQYLLRTLADLSQGVPRCCNR
jgi:hypothetical protein